MNIILCGTIFLGYFDNNCSTEVLGYYELKHRQQILPLFRYVIDK